MVRKNRIAVNLAALATRLAEQRYLWEPLVSYDPAERYYVRLAVEQDFEAWLLTWLPGQSTGWHDHGGSAGAFVTLRGTLTERHAVPSLGRRGALPARNEYGRGPVGIVPRAQQLGAGTLRTFGSRHIHTVANNGLTPAVSLHVYSPSLVEMNQYREADGLLELTNSQLAGVNW